MIIYMRSKTIKDIDEMFEGNTYSVCGICGALNRVFNEEGKMLYRFQANKEDVCLFIAEEELKERIKYGLVTKIGRERRARPATLEKLFNK